MTDKVTFDGDARVATVINGVTSLDIRVDFYSAWVRWAASPGNSVYWEAFRRSGLDPVPGGFTGDIYFLYNNWKLVIDFRYVRVTGVLFSDNFETAYYTNLLEPLYPPKVAALVNTINTGTPVITGDIAYIPTAAQNASAIRTELSTELARIDVPISTAVGGLTPTQSNMMLELFNIFGLDPTKPLIVNNNTNRRTAGSITQSIITEGDVTTVTRL